MRKIVVYDNFSTDRSPEIIASHPLTVYRRYDTGGKCSQHAITQIKNHAWKQSRDADWVIVCDIDELLYHPNGLDYVFNQAKGVYSVVKPIGYSMVTPEYPTTDQPIWSVYKRGLYDKMFAKCALFDPKRIKNMNYASGSHRCHPQGDVAIGKFPRFVMLHYRFLGREDTIKRFQLLWTRMDGNLGKYGRAEYLYDVHHKYAKEIVKDPMPVIVDLLPPPYVVTVKMDRLPKPQILKKKKPTKRVARFSGVKSRFPRPQIP